MRLGSFASSRSVASSSGCCEDVLRSRRARGREAAIGFEDGTSTVLDVGSPERELLIAAAGDVA